MQRCRLGSTDIEVPAVGLGIWQVLDVRGHERAEARHEAIGAALESGVGLFDCSPMHGEAKRLLGEALESVPVCDPYLSCDDAAYFRALDVDAPAHAPKVPRLCAAGP